jgi:hypothetical protein
MSEVINAGGVRDRVIKTKTSRGPKTLAGSSVLALLWRDGISPILMHDLSYKQEFGKIFNTGKLAGRRATRWFNPVYDGDALFRDGGWEDLEELGTILQDSGYLLPGEINTSEVYNLIQNELAGKRAEPAINEDEWEKRATQHQDPSYPWLDEVAAKDMEDLRRLLMTEHDIRPADIDSLTDDDIAVDSELFDRLDQGDNIASLLSEWGYTDDEIEHELRRDYDIADAIEHDRSAQEGPAEARQDAASPAGSPAEGRAGAQGLARSGLESRAENVVNDQERAPGTPRREVLLLMPCGETKLQTPGLHRADALYTGPMWLTLRARGDRGDLGLVIVSAKHGPLAPDAEIEAYDEKMTPERADMLIDAIANGNGSPVSPQFQFTDVQIVGGAEYRRVMRAWVQHHIEHGLINPNASVREITGQIGEQRQQLKAFMAELPPDESNPQPSPKTQAELDAEQALEDAVHNLVATAAPAVIMQLGHAVGITTRVLPEVRTRLVMAPTDVVAAAAQRMGLLPREERQGVNLDGGLESYSEEDLRRRAASEEERIRAENKAGRDDAAAVAKARAERENKARADQTVEGFELGQSAEQQMSGQGDLLSQPEAKPARDEPLIELRKRKSVLEALLECLG